MGKSALLLLEERVRGFVATIIVPADRRKLLRQLRGKGCDGYDREQEHAFCLGLASMPPSSTKARSFTWLHEDLKGQRHYSPALSRAVACQVGIFRNRSGHPPETRSWPTGGFGGMAPGRHGRLGFPKGDGRPSGFMAGLGSCRIPEPRRHSKRPCIEAG